MTLEAAGMPIYARSMGAFPLPVVVVGAAALLSNSALTHSGGARAGTVPACSLDYVTQATTVAWRVGTEVVGVTSLGTWGTGPCQVRGRLSFAAQPASDRFSTQGVIRAIEGNPGKKSVDLVLRPGGELVYAWRWRNWCGTRTRRFILQAS